MDYIYYTLGGISLLLGVGCPAGSGFHPGVKIAGLVYMAGGSIGSIAIPSGCRLLSHGL